MFDVTEYLTYEFNFAEFLKRRLMVGQIDPWRKYDDRKPIMALLVTVEVALDECMLWSGQDMTRTQLLKILHDQGVLVFSSVDEFAKWREQREAEAKEVKAEKKLKRTRRKLSEEERQKRREQMIAINKLKEASTV